MGVCNSKNVEEEDKEKDQKQKKAEKVVKKQDEKKSGKSDGEKQENKEKEKEKKSDKKKGKKSDKKKDKKSDKKKEKHEDVEKHAELPAPWEEVIHFQSKRTCYFNPEEMICQWDRPGSEKKKDDEKEDSYSAGHVNIHKTVFPPGAKLPAPWEEVVHFQSKKTCYFNPEKVVCQWDRPRSEEEKGDRNEDSYSSGHISIHKTAFPSDQKENDDISTFFTDDSTSLLKKYLTQEMYDNLKGKKTSTAGYTLQNAIQSGIDNQDSSNGVYAGDEDSYSDYHEIFDPVIEEYHGGYAPDAKHVSNMDPDELKKPDVDLDDYVISTRIRVGRNIRGYGLSPGISNEQRAEVEKLVTTALDELEDDLGGKYYPLDGMEEADRQQLVDDHFLFKKGDRFLESCGANRNWPRNRGIYHNDDKTFLVWVNEEDQTRIISMQKGGDFLEVFTRLARGIKAVEESIKKTADKEFMFNDHLGYIHSCPTNLGTGMRASVHIKLPKLSAQPDFKKICADLKLQPRGVHGEHSETNDGIYDISNKHRIGYTEVELVQTMIDGVQKLIEMEKDL